LSLDPWALVQVGALLGVGLMVEQEQEVALTLDMEEELVQPFVVRPVVGVVMKSVAEDTTGTRSWVLLVLAVIMLQLRTNMLGEEQGSMVSKKLVSPGLAIAVASSSYPSPSFCHSC